MGIRLVKHDLPLAWVPASYVTVTCLDTLRMSTLNSDSKFEWSILSNSGDTLGAKVDKPSKSGFVVKAQPFNLNHIRCSIDIGRLILGMIPVSRQDVDADIAAVNPQSKFCRSILYDKRDAILVPKLDKISEGRLLSKLNDSTWFIPVVDPTL